MEQKELLALLDKGSLKKEIKEIAVNVINGVRISTNDALVLYKEAELSLLELLSDFARKQRVGDIVTFNRNYHFEPTNICSKHCLFCSYRRDEGEDGAWVNDIADAKKIASEFKEKEVTEVHITGGVHPDRGIEFHIDLVKAFKEVHPTLHVKAFSAVEIDEMCYLSGISVEEGLCRLKEAGLGSIPGGGAEIFDEAFRETICQDKTGSQKWLDIHETAHNIDMKTNATMLYGLTETFEHRVDHLNRLRELQDRTGGFNCFIPLKFRRANNHFDHVQESTLEQDLRNYAVSRIFLDNIAHLKAYWPMIGKKTTALALNFGVDDLDGTIDDTTKIYSMAGVEDQNPSASTEELIGMITNVGRKPAERDTLFNVIKQY